MEYKVLTAYNSRKISEAVNKHLALGWVPQGGVSQHGSPSRFAQAMVRKSKGPRNPKKTPSVRVNAHGVYFQKYHEMSKPVQKKVKQ